MPLTLALDCALRRINLGASDGGKLLGEFSADVGARQSEILPPAVQNFLSALGKTVRDVELIAVTAGPGYFTGIRVGLSYAT
ncbi:MAG: tRNA (adenosine(37)-N6)-threonylcarbamoyltransferase complex dimerization subunit type 1 TsaB, partial [Synergistaceae bacterium]|nr:tRNA (adenosine(37)-N6)-threonylcarbamoyltransferase complex dimerization subunit type 1 TsaB [Synergistaceae bacterium]